MKARPVKFHSYLHGAHLLQKRLDTLLAPMGIRPRQARVLNTLSGIGETSQTVLAQQFDVTAGSMSTMIERLLALGLISREKNPSDKPGDLIALTPEGKDALLGRR